MCLCHIRTTLHFRLVVFTNLTAPPPTPPPPTPHPPPPSQSLFTYYLSYRRFMLKTVLSSPVCFSDLTVGLCVFRLCVRLKKQPPPWPAPSIRSSVSRCSALLYRQLITPSTWLPSRCRPKSLNALPRTLWFSCWLTSSQDSCRSVTLSMSNTGTHI